VYSTCIHCAASLGQNEALERFPVGRRLAFDPARGRLWVVCRACERWNLSPLDERWETIEDAEGLFRDSKLRVSTDEIGLCRLRDGLELVRIGEPKRPEMAAWRYGDQFGRRRRKQLLVTGAVVGSAASVFGAVLWAGAAAASFAGVYANGAIWDALINGKSTTVVARIVGPDGAPLLVQRRHARMSALERGEGPASFRLRLEHTKGTNILHGEAARRAAAQLLPTVNRFGGSRKDVQRAVGVLESAGDPERALHHVQNAFGSKPDDKRPGRKSMSNLKGEGIALEKLPGVLHGLPTHQRLALEMALHEESERRAMDGELDALTRAWREAEEIAGIADDMFTSPAVDERMSALQSARKHKGND